MTTNSKSFIRDLMTKKQWEKDKHEYDKLVKRLRRNLGQAIDEYQMIKDGDHIMVCMSGGKDSYALLDLLLMLRESAPIDYRITAVNLDQKQPGFPEDVLPQYLREKGVDFRIVERDTYAVVKRLIPEGKTACSLCSRLRRGILYKTASEIGASKIALGHHRSDIIETFFLNLFYGGKLKAMPPKLTSDDGKHVVIRPLAYCKEEDLERFAQQQAFPIIPCDLCGSQPNLQRQVTKDMLREWDRKFPGRVESIFRAMANVVPSHLMDHQLFPFRELVADGIASPEGDLAFDPQSSQGHPIDWDQEPRELAEQASRRAGLEPGLPVI